MINKKIFSVILSVYMTAAAVFPSYAFYQTPENKKGLAISGAAVNECKELGVTQIIWNNPINHSYERLYQANKDAGITNTIIMLNPWQNGNPALLPVSKPARGAVFYGFNVSSEEAKTALRATAQSFAHKYKDLVSNWIIGNEINNGRTWNYMPTADLASYTQQYCEGFKIWYEAIKSENPEARVFIPFDHRWKWYSDQGAGIYQAKDMMPIINNYLKDTDYGIAWHAYPQGLVDPDFRNDADVKDSLDSPLINMKNLHVLTDFFSQQEYLSPGGEVRHIILSEQGFNATSEALQAEVISEAYKIARDNPYIEGFYLSRQNDVGETFEGKKMKFGLRDAAGNKRAAYEVYKNLE